MYNLNYNGALSTISFFVEADFAFLCLFVGVHLFIADFTVILFAWVVGLIFLDLILICRQGVSDALMAHISKSIVNCAGCLSVISLPKSFPPFYLIFSRKGFLCWGSIILVLPCIIAAPDLLDRRGRAPSDLAFLCSLDEFIGSSSFISAHTQFSLSCNG